MAEAVAERERFTFSGRAEPFALRAAPPRVHGYAWRHPSPRAVLLLLHGLQSHAQWFAEAADLLLDCGLSVYALDRRGSGSSPGERGDIERYTDWFEDVVEVARLARQEFPDAPLHLAGHCFGANVAAGTLLTHSLEVRSLVMLTPGFYVRPDYSGWEKMQMLACGPLFPKVRFRVPQTDDLFTRDPEVLAWIEGDTLGARTLTDRCLLQIGRMVYWLRGSISGLPVPLLVLEAARDRISDNTLNRALLERALPDRCRFVTFDAEHFLLAEPCRDQVVETLVEWVDRHPSPVTRHSPEREL